MTTTAKLNVYCLSCSKNCTFSCKCELVIVQSMGKNQKNANEFGLDAEKQHFLMKDWHSKRD